MMSDCTCTNCVFITDGRSYWDMDLKTHIALELHCEKHTKRRLKISDPANDLIAQIDIEIEACERAIRKAYSVKEVEELSTRVKELIKKRFVIYNSKRSIDDD